MHSPELIGYSKNFKKFTTTSTFTTRLPGKGIYYTILKNSVKSNFTSRNPPTLKVLYQHQVKEFYFSEKKFRETETNL